MDPLSGEGARLFGGRWNHKGTRLIYCAGTQSLAVLECLVHFELQDVPNDYQAIGIEIPDGLTRKTLTPQSLPSDWKGVPGPESLKAMGTDWVKGGTEAVWVVPSAIIPDEWNYLINPDHLDAGRIASQAPKPFFFDRR